MAYDFKFVEEDILGFWVKNKIYNKVVEKNKGNKKFYFLQGPPYTSGRIHMGQAWNNSLKDMALRYFRMKGYDVWDRAGYDMHGLPTSRKVQAKFGLKTKEDIVEFGMEKFINECLNWAKENAQKMNEDILRLGVWMDFEKAYWPIRNSYIESVWWLVKQAEEKERLYEGLRTMSWCPNCATAMAKHECTYKEVEEPSIFVKFKRKDKDNEYFIIWTTTPWTIAFNLAIMVNPELDYVKAKVDDEVWIVAKGLVAPVVQTVAGKEYKIVEEFKGEDMEGWEFVHPWEKDIPQFKKLKEKHPNVHTVLLSKEYVSLKAGSGLVHTAPGCGPEDYEVGHQYNVPPFNNIKENGMFPEDMGRFAGLVAKKDDLKFVDALKKDGVLIDSVPVEHDYAHCERCKSPVVFRTTKQWFFKTEDLKDEMIKANEKTKWVPESAKNAFRSWLENLRDNSITKQRFWGTPVPIWKCGCGKYKVVASRNELESLGANKIPENLHKPWIDEVTIPCECGKKMKRLPDVLDVWIDAGVASWASLDYPQNTELFDKLYPVDFILEGKDQIRGWFNLLTISSIIALDKPCFKACYMHGMITDVDGVKMSKSLGNVISPYELIDKFGADTLRFYMGGTNAGEDVNFSWDEAELKYKYLSILWNVHKYLIQYCNNFNINLNDVKNIKKDIEENYIYSRLHSTIKKVSESYENYLLDDIPDLIESLFLDLSRTYIKLTREKINDNPEVVLKVIFDILFNLIKMLSTLSPYISEKMYLNLKEELNVKQMDKESVNLLDWPEYDKNLINEDLVKEFDIAMDFVQSILAAREKANLGVRWPIGNVTFVTSNKGNKKVIEKYDILIKNLVNAKKINIKENIEGVVTEIRINKNALGKDFKSDVVKILPKLNDKILKEIKEKGQAIVENFELNKEHIIVNEKLPEDVVSMPIKNGNIYIETKLSNNLLKEGFAREVMRRVQQMRKDQGLKKSDRINLSILSDYCLLDWGKEIKAKVGAGALSFSNKNYPIKDIFKVKDKEFKISMEKI